MATSKIPRIPITTGSLVDVNLNDVTITGSYTCGDMTRITNGPISNGYGTLLMFNSGTYRVQMFVTPSNAYVRMYASRWESWVKLS